MFGIKELIVGVLILGVVALVWYMGEIFGRAATGDRE
jgi:hypothetical protein